jgi:hypothetical protein
MRFGPSSGLAWGDRSARTIARGVRDEPFRRFPLVYLSLSVPRLAGLVMNRPAETAQLGAEFADAPLEKAALRLGVREL